MIVHRLSELNIDDITSIAVENGITVYDSSYIALTKQLKTPIVSNDNCAPKYNVTVYNFGEFTKIITSQNRVKATK